MVRDEAQTASDLDLFIDYDPDSNFNVLDLVDFKLLLRWHAKLGLSRMKYSFPLTVDSLQLPERYWPILKEIGCSVMASNEPSKSSRKLASIFPLA